MKRPSTQAMVVGHPVIAVPMTLVSGVSLLAGFHAGSVVLVLIAIAMIARIRTFSQQASAYRAWKAEWDGMAENPPRRSSLFRHIAEFIAAALMLVAVAILWPKLTYGFSHAYHWMRHEHWLLAGLGLFGLALLVQFIRCYPRRPKAAKPVTVIAKLILAVPSLADAYRALPPYCQHLLGRQQ